MLRRAVAAAVLLAGVAPAATPGDAHGAPATDRAVRLALAGQLDRAGLAAEQRALVVPGRAPFAATLEGVRSVVVRDDTSLAGLARQLPAAAQEVRPGVWEIQRTVFVTRGATLTIASPAVRQVRLVSRGRGFATLVGRHGSLRFRGPRDGARLRVRAWRSDVGRPDLRTADGRGSVAVRGAARLDATDTRFEDLGFWEGRVSGVALTAPEGAVKPTGVLRRSTFARNWFGAYTFEARAVRWTDNRFVDNVVYGLDPHDDSDGFVVARNYAAGNGKHGIIFSRLCDRNVIVDNVAVRNGWHGIVLDDGDRADGPSNHNRIERNVVRDNGRVGISIDGSGENVVARNAVSGQPVGVRLLGPSFGNRVEDNELRAPAGVGVFVDRLGAANAVLGNRVRVADTAVRVRGAPATTIAGNLLAGLRAHGVKVDGTRTSVAGTVVSGNVIRGRGRSPVLVDDDARAAVTRRDNQDAWDYPTARDVARLLTWGIGPGIWMIVIGAAALGPLAFGVGGARARVRALGIAAAGGAVLGAGIVVVPGDEPADTGRRAAAHAELPRAPVDPRVGASENVDPGASPLAERVVTEQGHPTHPTWYHDTQLVLARGAVVAAWNARDGVRAGVLDPDDLEIRDKAKVSATELGGEADSTGTDTNRHDVPGVVADDRGRVHLVYGGGSVAADGDLPGPLYRTAVPDEDGTPALGPERPLLLGGAAFDFETVTAPGGTRHLIGQRGRGDTGTLVELRLTPAGRWLPARELVQGGFRRGACVLDGRPRGCNRFAIARMTASPDGRLHLVWGWSEASLGGKCRTDAGFCDHDLMYAVSADGGATWGTAQGDAIVRIGPGRAIAHDDARFRVARGHVGVFKAVGADGDGTPLIVSTEIEDDRATLVAHRRAGGRWQRTVIARPGQAGVRSWHGSPVLRRDASGWSLWIPTGDRIFRFASSDGARWRRALVHRGPAWSLTGLRMPRGRQLLMWRGTQHGDRSDVVAALVPAAI